MPVGFNLNITYGLKPKSVASKLSLFTDDPFFSCESLYHKDSITSRPLNKVKGPFINYNYWSGGEGAEEN